MKTNAAMVMVNRLSTNHAERLNAAATMNGCVECEEGESCNFKGECISCTSLSDPQLQSALFYYHVTLGVYN